MNPFTVATLSALATSLVMTLIWIAVIPWLRMERLRRRAKGIRPQPGQIWRQEDDMLYVVETTNTGLRLMRVDANSGQVTEFTDTWVEWQERIQNRVVWYTGAQRALS